jgi:ATP-dependent RNA helicase DeaD
VTSYHGELNSNDRAANLDSFRNGSKQMLVCTDIAARGIDIPEVCRYDIIITLRVTNLL